MLTAAIIGIIVVLGVFLIYLLAKRALLRTAKAYLERPNPETPSEAGAFIASVAAQVGQQTAFHLKQAVLGAQSGQAHGEMNVDRIIQRAAITEGHPGMAALLKAVPGLGDIVDKNPALVGYALSKLGGKPSAQEETPPDNGSAFMI